MARANAIDFHYDLEQKSGANTPTFLALLIARMSEMVHGDKSSRRAYLVSFLSGAEVRGAQTPLPPYGNGPHVFLRTVASNLSPNSSSSEGLISLAHESGPAPHHAFERLPAIDCAKFFTVHLRLLLPAKRRSWRRLRPELIYSRVIAPMRLRHSSRRTAAGVLSGIERANVWSPSRPRLMGRILGRSR
jgi:hypothetical protein